MKTKILIIPFLSLSIAFLSCEKIIDIDIPEGERKIVINGLINPDSLVKINVSRSLSVLENDQFVFLENARVHFYENDDFKALMTYDGGGFYSIPGFYPVSNAEYRIEVESAGLQSVQAITNLPSPITMTDIDTSSVTDEWGGGSLKMSFSLNDPEEENYYAVSMFVTHKIFDYENFELLDSLITYPIYFDFVQNGQGGIQDRLIENNSAIYFNNKVFLSDQLFNGKLFDLDLSVGKYFFGQADTVKLEVKVDHVSKSYYLYAASLNKYYQANGNPFSEAVSVFTNIEKGLGIFTGYSSTSRSLNVVSAIKW